MVDDRGHVCDPVVAGREVRGEVRDVRDYPGPSTAALVTQASTAALTGAVRPVEMFAGLRHGLPVGSCRLSETSVVRRGEERRGELCLYSAHLGSTGLPELARVILNTVPRRLDLKIILS